MQMYLFQASLLFSRYNTRMTKINMHQNNRLTVSFLDKSLILLQYYLSCYNNYYEHYLCWYCYSFKKLILALQNIMYVRAYAHVAMSLLLLWMQIQI